MSARGGRVLGYGQLLRLPNVFTAVADPLAGWLVIGGSEPGWHLVALAAASGCLYSSGVVFNDCFDVELDRRQRPGRPLPAGVVSLKAAWILAWTLMGTGLLLCAVVGPVAVAIGGFLAGMIFFYNAWAKRFALLGPLVLGTCRFANFLLGMRAMPPGLWLMPVTLAVYVVAVAALARQEAGNRRRQRLVSNLLLGIIVVDAGMVWISPWGGWAGAALVLSLLVPAVALKRWMPMS